MNDKTQDAQLPPDITAKHHLTRLLRQLIPDVKTGVVDDFHAVIDRYEAASRTGGGQAQEYKQIAEGLLMLDWILGYELTQEKMEFLDHLRNRAAALLEADALAPSTAPQDERCGECGHNNIAASGQCVESVVVVGGPTLCLHRCDFSRPTLPQTD